MLITTSAPSSVGTASSAVPLATSSAAQEPAPAMQAAAGLLQKENLSKAIQAERDQDVTMARAGQYDQPLTSLAHLHEKYPDQEGITRDYIAVLSWAGHDEESLRLYESAQVDQQDYVLAAAGHSYRVTHQPENALAAYRLGEQKYPDNVIFVDGEIRSLMDEGKLDDAATRADTDLKLHGNRAEIVAAKADIVQAQIKIAHDKAVDLARNKNYDASLALLRGDLLDADHTTDPAIRRDYLAVLGWAGGHDDQVISIYQSLKDGDQPDYVLEAVAKAYRDKRQYDSALAVYRQGEKQYPDNTIFAMGEIDVLLDQEKVNEALPKIKAFESAHGSTPELEADKKNIAQIKFNAARRQAIVLARHGHYDKALALLRKLGGEHTSNGGIAQDRLAITDWMGGHDQQVVNQYQALHNPNQPDYVLEAVGHAYRNLGKTDEALAVYERGLRRYPRNENFAVGTIRSLTDAGYIEKALAVANDNLRRYGNRLDVLLAAGDAANQYNQNDALRYYQAAAVLAPKNPEVLRGLIRTSDRLGAPEVGLKTIRENPGIVSDSERRQIEGDELAKMVRVGQLNDEEGKETPRYASTDKALEAIDAKIAAWQQQGPDAEVNVTRARFDRVIALHNRNRMQEAAAEYESLIAAGATPPVYALGAAGDAYLDLHEPEKARDVLLQLLAIEPRNNLARRQLFYAYVDLGDYRKAYRIADEMVSDGTMWSRDKNASVAMTPDQHREAELTSGAARLYFGEVSEADMRIISAASENPGAPSSHEAMGNLDNAHQHPREALQHYQEGLQAAGGDNISNEVGIANTQLALHNFAAADGQVQSLMQRYSDNASVLRTDRDWNVYNMAELDLHAGYAFEPMVDGPAVNGGQAYWVGGKIYSAPYDYNWRIFAGEDFTHQKEPGSEGQIGVSRSAVGVEYRNGPLTANLAPTYNVYHNDTRPGVEGNYHDDTRVGVAGDATYAINDNWTVAGSGELFSTATPLRALNQGVTADFVGGHALWQQDETRSVRFGGSVMPFSDGNLRTEEDADFTQRLWTYPYWSIDGIVSAGLDQNSANENRFYYNPSADFMGLVGARATEVLYQRYSTLWQHSLTVTPGLYWEQNYGTDAALRMRYEHRVFFNETFEAGAGVNFSRQDYDGVAENDVSVTVDLVDHF